MKVSIFKILKVYFILLAILIVLGIAALMVTIPRKNRLHQQLLEHPYVREKLAEGFEPVEGCGNYQRTWNTESSSLCLEKAATDSTGKAPTLRRVVLVRETGSGASSCEYRAISPTDTLCLP
jgi:hypothetical protein